VTENNKTKSKVGEKPFLKLAALVMTRIQKKIEVLQERRTGLALLEVNLIMGI
jgi:hypothetical protein